MQGRKYRNRKKPNDDPLKGFWGGVGKFICSALFGVFVSVVIAVIFFYAHDVFESKTGEHLLHILWIIPLIWGVLGVFYFDGMLTLAASIFEKFFNVEQ